MSNKKMLPFPILITYYCPTHNLLCIALSSIKFTSHKLTRMRSCA